MMLQSTAIPLSLGAAFCENFRMPYKFTWFLLLLFLTIRYPDTTSGLCCRQNNMCIECTAFDVNPTLTVGKPHISRLLYRCKLLSGHRTYDD